MAKDSLIIAPTKSENALESQVEYSAKDSMRFEIKEQKVYLFGGAEVAYEQTSLKANYIELNLNTKELYAVGTPDSIGKIIGKPEFTDGGQTFSSEEMRYNFESKKGKITNAITQEGDGYIHGKQIKVMNEDVIFIKNGKYTTCSNEIPHFHIEATKLKFIKDDKIVTGPAYMVVEQIPTPLAVPFGFFPNKQTQTSGIVIPTYGESPGLGFFLTDGGYYLAVNEFLDLALTGDLYSRGSWGLGVESNYKVRYKFDGYVDLSYSQFKRGESGINQSKSNNYFIRWKHTQDPKARPYSNFSADVNFGSTKNFQNNFNSSAQDYLTNTFKSNVSYNKRFGNKPLNFTLNANHTQNSRDSSVTVTLPDATFTVSRLYPFKRKVKVGENKWYENIGVAYTGVAQNRVTTTEDIFTNYPDSMISLMDNGMRHSIPISTSFKLLKFFTLTPTVNYVERWYLESVSKSWDYAVLRNTETGEWTKAAEKSEIVTMVPGFARAGEYSFSSGLSTTIYGTFNYKLKKLKAIRHVMFPSANINLQPDYSSNNWGYYSSYEKLTETDTLTIDYSRFDGMIMGGPSGKSQSGMVSFSLRNTLEAKILTKKDTTGTPSKLKIFENLNFNTSYSIFADSLNWTPVRVYLKSRLTPNIDFQINSVLDPYAYAISETGSAYTINKALVNKTGDLARLTNLDFVLTWRLKSKQTKETAEEKNTKEQHGIDSDLYVDFKAPWTLSLSYRFNYSKPYQEQTITNTLNVTGDIRITPKWKVGFRTGYDFEAEKMNYTSFDIYRDLHCWELNFNVVPFGARKSYSVDLRVKAPVLSDLKLSRKRSWYDFQ